MLLSFMQSYSCRSQASPRVIANRIVIALIARTNIKIIIIATAIVTSTSIVFIDIILIISIIIINIRCQQRMCNEVDDGKVGTGRGRF